MFLSLLKSLFDKLLSPQIYESNLFLRKRELIPGGMRLKIDYHSQRDNEIDPTITCNTTVLNTVLDYIDFLPEKKEYTDDEITEFLGSEKAISAFKKMSSRGGKLEWAARWNKKRLRELWVMLEWAGNYILDFHGQTGYFLKFKGFNSISKIHESINRGLPVICGLRKKKNRHNFGHFILCVGYTDTHLIFHDPWGDWNTYYNNRNGAYVYYSKRDMKWAMYWDRSIYVVENTK